MTTSTLTLADFLLARYAEREHEAHALADAYDRDEVRPAARLINYGALVVPRQVLAECEAMLRIVERHSGQHICEDSLAGERWDEGADDLIDWPCDDLRILGSVFTDRPDYREEWRP